MDNRDYDKTRQYELEAASAQYFSVELHVRQVLFDYLQLNQTAAMTVFSTDKKNLYAYVESSESLNLSTVERLIKKAGFVPSHYAAPHGNKNYFKQRAHTIFKSVYPGRNKWTEGEEAYYMLLAPYSPALVKLRGINGNIQSYSKRGKSWNVIYEPSNRLLSASNYAHKTL